MGLATHLAVAVHGVKEFAFNLVLVCATQALSIESHGIALLVSWTTYFLNYPQHPADGHHE